ncbi:methionine--tRNA ligase [Viridibacillus sp. YIM B01967]|uniref:Methionine--tRNA ligase n=1 Tax=Viridibacillus soli TaxID=2798301 RepID=A0ABS1H411_9BACL|nr:methionine--tRNA ligase [Viridibacillus soli]MBK3494153.1 methionine--tRNA ligase [Viridibacillus soli]
MSIVIGGAWPYANGSLHLGHIAALLPGDILARYYRLKKEEVLYVSGSDCNGTPISIRANQEGVTVKEIADRYHDEFTASFNKLGFTYDLYTRTDTEHHHVEVQNIFLALLDNGFLYKKSIEQTYCENDKQFLPDRFVEGFCPVCGSKARGDQCDHCSTILDPLDLIDRRCKICGNEPIVKETEHFYFALSKLQNALEHYVENAKEQKVWRQNAIDLSQRYLADGVPDRAVTRDLLNGVDVPIDGFDGKKIYVWIEAVSGYYTASLEWAKQNQKSVQDYWHQDTISYYVHGKDNIPFHTIIWPAILMGINNPALPTHIVSNEYLTLEKRKLSTSLNWAVWVPYIIEKYDADTIRYFLTINAPENRDTDFSWREFIYSHNSELLGAYGNFVNRTLKFIEKSFDKQIPKGIVNPLIQLQTKKLYDEVGFAIEQSHFKAPLEEIFYYIRSANKYFDEQQPWLQIKENTEACANTLTTCVYIIANLSQLLDPFIPFSTKKIRDMLGITDITWHELVDLPVSIHYVEPLFQRLDVALIEEEFNHLVTQSNTNV